jgi:hypothetical protein
MRGFPQYVISPGRKLWRIHGSRYGPWYFRSDGTFRFDLVDRPGHGTCYFAEDPLGAFVEALQGFRTVSVPRAELRTRVLFAYSVDHALVLADVTHSEAARYGLDTSISGSTPSDYETSQDFARDAFDGGFAGVRYWVRHDLTQQLTGVALFGPDGGQPDDLLRGDGAELDEELLARACEEASFRTQGPLLDPA